VTSKRAMRPARRRDDPGSSADTRRPARCLRRPLARSARSAARNVPVSSVGVGAPNRIQAESRFSQSDRQGIADFVRDDAGWRASSQSASAGASRRAPRPRRRNAPRDSPQARVRAARGCARSTPDGGGAAGRERTGADDPQPPFEQSASHPAGFLNDRRSPATQRGLEIGDLPRWPEDWECN